MVKGQEVRRVLRPGGKFILYEICAGTVPDPLFPVPWAGNSSISFMIDPRALLHILEQVGFKMLEWRDVTAVSMEWNQQLVANMASRPVGAPPPLGLNLLMGPTTGQKVKNMLVNMQEERIRVIQGVMLLAD